MLQSPILCSSRLCLSWRRLMLRSQVSRLMSTDVESARTRNIGIIAHIDAGKTTTTERMLYYSGYIPRIGDVDQGNTVMDYLPAERERGITIQSAAITFPWRDHRLNLIDTPGHADFTFEVERSLRVLDGAVTILDAVAGVEAQTEKVWRQANTRQIPRIIFINKMDRVGAGFGRTVREVSAKLDCRPLVLQLPIFESGLDGGDYIGVLDLLRQECLVWTSKSDGKSVQVTPLAEYNNVALVQEAQTAREALVETLSELDESVVNAYLECEDAQAIPVDILQASVRRQCLASAIVPVLTGASFRNIGVQPLLDGIIDYLPAPSDRPAPEVTEDGKLVPLKPSDGACALAFKVIVDAQRGPMVFVRVYAGSINRGAVLLNNTTRQKERALKILQMNADEARETDAVEAGNIAVILGLKNTRTGDTLTQSRQQRRNGLQLQPIDVDPPVFIATLETTSKSEAKALELALDNLLREDPSLRVWFEEETGQTLLGGMGELHLEIAGARLVNEFKAKVTIGKLRIGYRETIERGAQYEDLYERTTATTRAAVQLQVHLAPLHGVDSDGDVGTGQPATYKKEDLMDGNFYEISVPATGSVDFNEVDARAALQEGAAKAMLKGPVIGYPIHSMHVRMTIDAYDADSTLSCLSSAAYTFTKRALKTLGEHGESDAGMTVLEPIMAVSVSVQGSTLGAVMNDLSGVRGGHIMALDETSSGDGGDMSQQEETRPRQHFAVYAPPDSTLGKQSQDEDTSIRNITARVPLKEMVGYARALRTVTGGRGNFTMTVDSFEKMTQKGLSQLKDSLVQR